MKKNSFSILNEKICPILVNPRALSLKYLVKPTNLSHTIT